MKTSFLKKLIAVMLSVCFCFSLISAVSYAESDVERAERFVSAVEQFYELSDLDEKVSYLEALMDENVYFDDESYEGVTEALAALRRYEEQINLAVDSCNAFIDAIETALMTDISDYADLKSAITEAEKYLDRLDNTYDGISGAKADYSALLSELRGCEDHTDSFLNAVKTMSDAVGYKNKNDALARAEGYIRDAKFIDSYSGVADALLTIEAAKVELAQIIVSANGFISLVNALGDGDTVAGMNAAYAALESTDFTAPGAASAKAMLDAAKDAYNEKVKVINSDWGML